MPVLPDPDPQVWRMLLGDRAEEILGRAEENGRDTPRSEVSPDQPPAEGKSRREVTKRADGRKRNADET